MTDGTFRVLAIIPLLGRNKLELRATSSSDEEKDSLKIERVITRKSFEAGQNLRKLQYTNII